MEWLRRATTPDHEALEREVSLMRPDVSLQDYRDYLVCMRGLHAPLEAALDRLTGLAEVLPDVASRRRLGRLDQDLSRLGLSPAELESLPQAPDLPTLHGIPQALGILYVLEGSTLGGQILRKHLEARLGPTVAGALTYLEAYPEVGPPWKRFREAVDRYGQAHPEAQPVLVEAASQTFRCLRGWFTQRERV